MWLVAFGCGRGVNSGFTSACRFVWGQGLSMMEVFTPFMTKVVACFTLPFAVLI
jgi:hypothetical protein